MQEKFQKEKSKLEENKEMVKVELLEQLSEQKNQNKKFKNAMSEIIENYKTSICSLKVS